MLPMPFLTEGTIVQVNFLSHIFLSKKGDGPKIAKRLVDVYIALFKVWMWFSSV
jgi:hypothetical protein